MCHTSSEELKQNFASWATDITDREEGGEDTAIVDNLLTVSAVLTNLGEPVVQYVLVYPSWLIQQPPPPCFIPPSQMLQY